MAGIVEDDAREQDETRDESSPPASKAAAEHADAQQAHCKEHRLPTGDSSEGNGSWRTMFYVPLRIKDIIEGHAAQVEPEYTRKDKQDCNRVDPWPGVLGAERGDADCTADEDIGNACRGIGDAQELEPVMKPGHAWSSLHS